MITEIGNKNYEKFKNMIVKIPVTSEALSAFEEATYQGVSINATVSFSVAQTIAVAEAIERGLKRREAAAVLGARPERGQRRDIGGTQRARLVLDDVWPVLVVDARRGDDLARRPPGDAIERREQHHDHRRHPPSSSSRSRHARHYEGAPLGASTTILRLRAVPRCWRSHSRAPRELP